ALPLPQNGGLIERLKRIDLTTWIGILVGLGLIAASIAVGEGGMFFINLPSVMIVFGGTIGATLINFRLRDILPVFRVLAKVFVGEGVNYDQTIDILVRMADKARREGLLSLDRDLGALNDPFLRAGLQMAVDGVEPETTRSILRSQIAHLEERHQIGQNIFLAMAGFAPAFGMIGTLIGLIKMLQFLEDPSKLGFGMATALITTFYGALSAYLFFLPAAGKLAQRTREEVLGKELIIEGVTAILNGENPRMVRERLVTFLSPRQADLQRKK
ncbi:MAG: motility protein A, partial [bacterium]